MKYLLIVVLCFSLVYEAYSQSAPLQDYPLQFTYRVGSGPSRDTALSFTSLRLPSGSSSGPTYLKWKDQSYGLLATQNGLRLCTDSATSFSSGQDIGWAFFKIRSLGSFEMDYAKSSLWQFVEDSDSPNMQVVLTSQGVQLKSLSTISPGSKLTVRYDDVKGLFPGDATVKLRSKRL